MFGLNDFDVNGTYVDSGAGTLRTTWCQTLDVA